MENRPLTLRVLSTQRADSEEGYPSVAANIHRMFMNSMTQTNISSRVLAKKQGNRCALSQFTVIAVSDVSGPRIANQ